MWLHFARFHPLGLCVIPPAAKVRDSPPTTLRDSPPTTLRHSPPRNSAQLHLSYGFAQSSRPILPSLQLCALTRFVFVRNFYSVRFSSR
ncbi:hypothetical protein M407DRAFT_172419 [Tulasnella calospora MUT 4182]|uniref:Uncharacterized protein n=1 Tax=Tulasnella calospora MUT 4182 TaxID=1051891 RepID=A0A0C3K7P7_9AGAM|nr:hypothetical protein M407DRAFT_172419 [Tulasnella calospora MUT 4182]